MSIARILAALPLVLLAACGGGGGGSTGTGSGSTAVGAPSVSTILSTAVFSAVERNPATVDLTFRTTNFQGATEYYLVLEGGQDLLSNFDAAGEFSDTESVSFTLRDDLSVGVHTAAVKLHVCEDTNCKAEVQGSPLALTLTATVTPNIGVPAQVTLARTGAEAAPSQDVAVTIPAAAGAVSLLVESADQGLDLSLAGSVLHVATTQRPAGTYTATGRLQSASNTQYSADFSVSYTVSPPAGGEHGMSITPTRLVYSLSQGQVQTQQLVVTPPTWSSDYTPLSLASDCDAMYTLRDLGNFTYELKANAVGVAVGGGHTCTLSATAGLYAGVSASAWGSVGLAFAIASQPVFSIDRNTSAASLSQSTAIQMADGSAVGWTASTSSPWLVLTRASGTTGTDALGVGLDTTHLADYMPGDTADVLVSVGRADVPPQHLSVGLVFQGPYITHAWPGAIVSSGGPTRIYANGQFDYDAATNGSIQVSGARLVSAQQTSDSYFLGNVSVMALTIDQIVPGQPVTVSAVSPYLTTQATLQAIGTPSYAAGFAALPYGLRKPPSFSPLNGALYLAGQDTVWRFATDGSAWSLASRADAGVIDVDPRPDEAHLLAVHAGSIEMLDPTSLQPIWSGVPLHDVFGSYQVVGGADADSKSVTHTLDGNAWVTWGAPALPGTPTSSGVGLLSLGFLDTTVPGSAGVNTARGVTTPSASDGSVGEPWLMSDGVHRNALVSNALAQSVTWLRGDVIDRSVLALSGFQMTSAPAAIDAANSHILRKDGSLYGTCVGSFMPWNLTGALPAGQTDGGWGLTPDGRYALLYTYTLAGTGDAATASNPVLHVLDIDTTMCGGVAVPQEVASVPLAGVPGCGSPRASGETCAHTAHITVDPQQAVAFVSGPRGVAAVPLPSSVRQTLGAGRARAKAVVVPHELKAQARSAPH